MRDHSESHLLLLLLGVFLLTQHAKLPHWVSYSLMLLVLGGTRQLAPEWFGDGWLAEGWFDTFWRVCVGSAACGLLLETGFWVGRVVG